jgi:hypothetical protein
MLSGDTVRLYIRFGVADPIIDAAAAATRRRWRFFATGGVDKIGLKRSSLPKAYDMNSMFLPRPEPQRRSLRRCGP